MTDNRYFSPWTIICETRQPPYFLLLPKVRRVKSLVKPEPVFTPLRRTAEFDSCFLTSEKCWLQLSGVFLLHRGAYPSLRRACGWDHTCTSWTKIQRFVQPSRSEETILPGWGKCHQKALQLTLHVHTRPCLRLWFGLCRVGAGSRSCCMSWNCWRPHVKPHVLIPFTWTYHTVTQFLSRFL